MRPSISVLTMFVAIPAAAQEAPPTAPVTAAIPETPVQPPEPYLDPKTDVFDGNHMIVGIGIGALPHYEGADSNRIVPAFGALGRIEGFNFRIRGTNASVDLLRNEPGKHLRFRFGPRLGIRSNRSGNVDDPVVEKLGELKNSVEGGFIYGVSYRRIINPYDSLSLGGSVRWDLSGHGSGRIISAALGYSTPLSPRVAIGVQTGVSFVDDKYADYNYSVTSEGSIASGLPVYKAKGGMNKASLGGFIAYDLSGDFRDGGWMIAAGTLYTKLLNSAADTPITSIRGDADQWIVGAGIAFSF